MRAWKWVAAGALVVLLAACRDDGPGYEDPVALGDGTRVGGWYCDSPAELVALGLIDPAYAPSPSLGLPPPDASIEGEEIGGAEQPLYADMWSLWPTRNIPVCWEDSTYDPLQAAERNWVRSAVMNTWESALCGGEIPPGDCIHFVGWTKCSDGHDDGIRIHVEDAGPHVTALGKNLAGRTNGMRLNFSFLNWSDVCATSEANRQYCIEAVAAHEFGHALGMAHEQNRTDRPFTCTDAPQGTNGNAFLGPWDQESIMNYCNPLWNNGGVLSAGDVQWMRAAYYPAHYPSLCVPLSSLSDEAIEHGVPTIIEE